MNTWSWMDDMEGLRRELDRLLGSDRWMGSRLPYTRTAFLPGRSARAYPLVNVAEDNERFIVDALAPGLNPESIQVSITGNQLSITGEKKPLPDGVKAEAFHRRERATGKFVRTVTLPAEAETGKTTASYTDGLLHLTIPKSEAAKPKTITVNVN